MKNAKWMLPVTLMLLSGLMAAQSLTQSSVVAQVPFDFVVSNQTIPAGECVVKSAGMDSQILAIRNFDARKAALAAASHADNQAVADKTVMVFKHYGDRYFLSSIRIAGSSLTYNLPETKLEKELRAQNVSASETSLLASLR